jgi:hypothetical protein
VDTNTDENQMLAMQLYAEGHSCTLGCIDAIGKPYTCLVSMASDYATADGD